MITSASWTVIAWRPLCTAAPARRTTARDQARRIWEFRYGVVTVNRSCCMSPNRWPTTSRALHADALLWTDYPETEGRTAYPFHTKARNLVRLLVTPQRLAEFDLSQPLQSAIDFIAPPHVQRRVDERLAEFAPPGTRICVVSRRGVTAARKNWGDGRGARVRRICCAKFPAWRIVSMEEEDLGERVRRISRALRRPRDAVRRLAQSGGGAHRICSSACRRGRCTSRWRAVVSRSWACGSRTIPIGTTNRIRVRSISSATTCANGVRSPHRFDEQTAVVTASFTYLESSMGRPADRARGGARAYWLSLGAANSTTIESVLKSACENMDATMLRVR